VDEICSDLAAEHDALDRIVADLDEPGWNRATPAEGWDVADTIVHLVQADVAARTAVETPDRFVELRQSVLTDGLEVFGARNGQTGAELLGWWRTEREAMVAAFRSRAPKDRIPWFGPDMSTLSFATARLMETWSHGHDVADTFGAPWPPTDRLRHVAHIGVGTRYWSYANRGQQPPEASVFVDLEAPSGDRWTWGPPDAANRVCGVAVDFCQVVTQRRRPEETTLRIEGPAAVEWMELAQAFAGPPTTTPPARVR
jgi:uncharacterized protein (TIGR03084 family)